MGRGVYTISTSDAHRTRRQSLGIEEPEHVIDVAATAAEQIPYPRSVICILFSMFFERIAGNGMKTVLIIYLTTQLTFDNDEATLIYHSYMMLTFFVAIFGAIVSDSWLGKYRTVLVMFLLGIAGMLLLNLGSVPTLMLPRRELTIIALLIIGLGTGCMKPCVLAFGGDQFRIPEQLHLMSAYFSMVYFVLKLSAFVGTALTPMLRHDVSCFGQDSCFLLAFGVSGTILLIALSSFLVGNFWYVVRPTSGNIIIRVVKCIFHAIVLRLKSNKTNKHLNEASAAPMRPEHWLDYAEPRFGRQLVQDTKCLLNVLVLYVPIPVYWALNEQTGSRWTLQASRMVGHIFNNWYTIKPDQMQVSMQILLIAFIPLFEAVLYPLLARVGIRRPLHRIALAMAMAGTAFVLAGNVESQMARDYAVMPTPDACQLRVYNTWPHAVSVSGDTLLSATPTTSAAAVPNQTVINRLDALQTNLAIVAFNSSHDERRLHRVGVNTAGLHAPNTNTTILLPLVAGKAISYFYNGRQIIAFEDRVRKATSQRARLRILVVLRNPDAAAATIVNTIGVERQMHANVSENMATLTLYDMRENYVRYRRSISDIMQYELAATRYAVRIGDHLVTDQLEVLDGSVSTLLVVQRESSGTADGAVQFDVKLVELTPPNSMHMLWMLPQYTLLAAGEAIMGVTGMYFAYSESPESMKTVLQACWLLTIALGHLIDVIVVMSNSISSQSLEFFVFAGLMYGNILVFMWLISRYRPLSPCQKLANGTKKMSDKATDASKKPSVFTKTECVRV